MISRYTGVWGDTVIHTNFEDLRRAKAYREKRDLTLRTIATESGLSINTVQRIRNNTASNFDRKTLEVLCRYFAVKSISELIEYTTEE